MTMTVDEARRNSWIATASLPSFLPAPSSLPLDAVTGCIGGYSLARRLRAAYSGNAFRVRRSSDSTEQDIGFSGDVVDTASLLSFCAGTNGFVSKVYDQSTNGKDATQSTTANQPQIVTSGALTASQGGYPMAVFDGSNDCLVTAGLGTTTTDLTTVGVLKINTKSAEAIYWSVGASGSTGAVRLMLRLSSGSTTMGYSNWGGSATSTLAMDVGGAAHVWRVQNSGTAITFARDGVTDAQTNSTSMSALSSSAPLAIGITLGYTSYGAMNWGELLVFPSALGTSDAQSLEDSIGWRWVVNTTRTINTYGIKQL